MGRLEYFLSVTALRIIWLLFYLLPVRSDKVVLASARAEELQGNLKYIYEEMHAQRPDLKYVFLLHRYSYTLGGKLLYMGRMVRALYHLMTAGVFIVDNAYLPVHVVRHHKRTTVIQVWHAAGALKKFGLDVSPPDRKVENRFLHRHYDYVAVGSSAAVAPYASALRTDPARVLPLGSARTDFFSDESACEGARRSFYERYPALLDKKIVLYAPTFRGHGKNKTPCEALDAAALRQALPADYVLIRKSHPVIDDDRTHCRAYDAVVGTEFDINDLFTVTDVLITDYSSCIFEFARLRKPLILLVDDLEEYSKDPGMYIDYKTQMLGRQARSTDEVAAIISTGEFELEAHDSFIDAYCNLIDGHSSERFVEFVSGLLPAPRS